MALNVIGLVVPLLVYNAEDQRNQSEKAVAYADLRADRGKLVLLISDAADDADLRVPLGYS